MSTRADPASRAATEALDLLRKWGLILLQDPRLPSLARVVAGESVVGSWWGHPKGGHIFHAAGRIVDHPDVLSAKLVSGKVTFVHRRLWPCLIAIGLARQPWQLGALTPQARELLAQVDEKNRVVASGKPAKQLET